VLIERLESGRWMLTRERDENGERFDCDDLVHAFSFIRAAYLANGEPRPMVARTEVKGP
jgi:hypothetical protein